MAHIKNRRQLLSHGNIKLREAAVDLIEHALEGADPYKAVQRLIGIEGRRLTVGEVQFDLVDNSRIFLIGGGKASYPIARALEDLLGERITDGVVICKYGQPGRLSRIRLYHAAHPIPDESGMAAARQALTLAAQSQPGDIVFGCVTGGSSALMPLPVDGVSLEEKKQVNRTLLTCGADIYEINSVRKHLSQIKGGRLALALHPQAHLINLTVSDVIGDELDYITDPTVADTSYIDDARATLNKYRLWKRLPASVVKFLNTAGPDQETPKPDALAGRNIHSFILVNSDCACEAAARRAEKIGFNSMILSTMLYGESKALGATFAAIAREIVLKKRPFVPPCVVIGGGETTVRIDGEAGSGGPNQEFALAAAAGIDEIGRLVVAAIDTDGTDGPTDIAGGMVDEQTLRRSIAHGLDLNLSLERHDAASTLLQLGDAVETGATGTNVNDLKLMLIAS